MSTFEEDDVRIGLSFAKEARSLEFRASDSFFSARISTNLSSYLPYFFTLRDRSINSRTLLTDDCSADTGISGTLLVTFIVSSNFEFNDSRLVMDGIATRLGFYLYLFPIFIRSSTASFNRVFSFSLSLAYPVIFVITLSLLLPLTCLGLLTMESFFESSSVLITDFECSIIDKFLEKLILWLRLLK